MECLLINLEVLVMLNFTVEEGISASSGNQFDAVFAVVLLTKMILAIDS